MVDMTQNLGRVIPNARGRYSNSLAYKDLDQVIYGTRFYRAKKNVTIPIGTLPTDTDFWIEENGLYTQEVAEIEIHNFTTAENYAMEFGNTYDRIEFDIDITLSATSMVTFDLNADDPPVFPDNSTYESEYSPADNYDELSAVAYLRTHASGDLRTKLFLNGAGFEGTNGVAINQVSIEAAPTIPKAINIIALNGATMTGKIIMKKYKYITI